jgi:adenine phosphoribosyltransferase
MSMPIKSRIRTVPDYPKKGILFRDITTLIKDPVGFRLVIDNLTQRYIQGDIQVDLIVGIEARGFIIGGALSYTLGKGFVPIRKKGKLPAEVVRHEYELEYGRDTVEVIKMRSEKAPKSSWWTTCWQPAGPPLRPLPWWRSWAGR